MDGTPRSAEEADGIRLAEPAGRWVLLVAVLGSGLALLDATVVNVALPSIGRDFGGSLGDLQWTVNGYTLSLAALILLGGSLGDRLGRRRVFVVGVVWFALASLLCALAPTIDVLIAARVLQGIGGALLTPGSLAIIASSFHPADESRAVGAWSGLGGVAAAVGPFLGGWLIAGPGWRWIFLINLPVAAVVVAATLRHVPESRDPYAAGPIDVTGSALGALGLAGITYALVAAGDRGFTATVAINGVAGLAALIAFLVREARSRHPMLPLSLFASRQFSAANAVTLAVYAALGGVFFLLVLELQTVAGFSPLQAGMSLLPVTALMLAGSAQAGALADRRGPRLPMTLGPLVCAAGVALLLRIGAEASYLTDVLPAVALFGIGLTLTVAPLTATVLASAPRRNAGVASGVNNAVARVAGLLAVAVLPIASGLSGGDYQQPAIFNSGFQTAMIICAVLLAVGGVVASLTISDRAVAAAALEPGPHVCERHVYCAVDGPPLEIVEEGSA